MQVKRTHEAHTIRARFAVHEHGIFDVREQVARGQEFGAIGAARERIRKSTSLRPSRWQRLLLKKACGGADLAAKIDHGADAPAGNGATWWGSGWAARQVSLDKRCRLGNTRRSATWSRSSMST